MAGETMRFRNPAGHRGLLGNLLGAVNALVAFLETRFELITQESKSALINVLILAGCLAAAALLCGLALILLVATAVVGLAHALQVSWILVALGFAVLLIVLALLFVLVARTRIKKPMFRTTAAELKKDREWLKNLEKTDLSKR
jgi:uncharacterized membrane protein YqjE